MINTAKDISFMIKATIIFLFCFILVKNVTVNHNHKIELKHNIDLKHEVELSNKSYQTLTIEHRDR